VYGREVHAKRRHPWVGFAIVAVLAILGLFVLGGIASGVSLFAAMLAFIFTCIYALRGENADTVAHDDKTAATGWFGRWF
jgi:hypothetical protein